MHDGTYIDNGPPPAGFTLHFHPEEESQRLPIELQGYYHCEVWGQGQLRKVASTKAFLRFNGKAVFLSSNSYSMLGMIIKSKKIVYKNKNVSKM